MKIKNIKYISALLALGLLANGCGSSPNDQGVSFTLIGFGAVEVDEGNNTAACTLEEYTNLINVPLSDIIEGNGVILGCPVVQNNMSNVTVRTERVNLSYFIPGATQQPPRNSTAASVVLGPTSTGGTGEDGETPTEGENTIDQRVSLPTNLVPQSTRAWLSQNRASLPNPPFSMDITVTVSGITSAGDQLVTNQLVMQANVINDIPINPGTGTDTETDTGEVTE